MSVFDHFVRLALAGLIIENSQTPEIELFCENSERFLAVCQGSEYTSELLVVN